MNSRVLPRVMSRLGIHYGWSVVAVIFLTTLSTSAVMGMVGVLMLPLKNEFGWDISAISAAMALRVLLFGLVAPFAAALMLRYGIRAVVGGALGLIVIGLGLASRMHELWQLWLTWGLMIGVAAGATANVLGATVATRWFTKRRGLVLGFLGAGNATGQLLFLPAAAWLAENHGWRFAMMPAGIMCVICLFLLLWIVREYPSDVGLPPYGENDVVFRDKSADAKNALLVSFESLALATRHRAFWILAGTFFVCGLSTSGLVQNHFIPLCHDFGVETMAAAGVLATIGACDFVGTILSGWLSDRFDNRWLLFWYYSLRGVSLLLLPYTNFSLYGLSLFALFYGLDWIATVPPTARLSGQIFGRQRGPVIFGWMFMAHQVGAATAALGGGVSRDLFASYLPAFIAAGGLCIVASFALLGLRHTGADTIGSRQAV